MRMKRPAQILCDDCERPAPTAATIEAGERQATAAGWVCLPEIGDWCDDHAPDQATQIDLVLNHARAVAQRAVDDLGPHLPGIADELAAVADDIAATQAEIVGDLEQDQKE